MLLSITIGLVFGILTGQSCYEMRRYLRRS